MQGLWTVVGLLWCWGQSPLPVQAAGCSSSVTSECGQLCYTGTNGTITLPTNCGGKYCNNMTCNYQVCPPSDTRGVFIAFPVMSVECGDYDYVVIDDTRICHAYNGSRFHNLDRNGCLNVTFLFDHSYTDLGFTMLYSKQPICPMNYTADADNVSLPTECDGHYCPNMNCFIGICPDSHSGYVTLTFALFHVDDSETCSRDVLEIDGTAYCSLDSVPRVFPLDQRGCLNLTFRSDNSHQGRGFHLSYKAGVAASCPAIYMGPKGVIISPSQCLQPTAPLSSSCGALDCAVKVCPGPKASNVSLAARQWDLSCPDDFLEAGGRRYCQASPQGAVLALDGRGCLDLLFHWNSSVSQVQLLYSLYNPECGVGDLVSDSGLLSVPTTCQGRYCDNLECSYRLCPLTPSSILAFSLLVMDMVGSSCTGDYLTIGTSQQKYCSLVNVPPVDVDRWGCVSAGFHSDEHGGGHGFLLSFSTYSEACGALAYLADHGSITLPADCDGKYCPNLNCTYTVCPQSRSTHVQIMQRMFHTADINCTDDYLIIDQTRVCEFDPMPKLYPVDDRGCLSMTFRSNNVNNIVRFWLNYTAISSSNYVTTETTDHMASAVENVTKEPLKQREVIVVASVLSTLLLVVIVALVVVSVILWRAKRRCPPAPPCLPPIDVVSLSGIAKAQENDYVDPVAPCAVPVMESNYESMEELYQNE